MINYKEFTEAFLDKFNRSNKGIEILKYWNKEKSFIKNFPFQNINIEVKPYSNGRFVIQMMDFEFFDNAILENYWRRNLIHKDAKFILNSKCIYVYPRNTNDVDLCLDVLSYTSGIILDTFNRIKNLLT